MTSLREIIEVMFNEMKAVLIEYVHGPAANGQLLDKCDYVNYSSCFAYRQGYEFTSKLLGLQTNLKMLDESNLEETSRLRWNCLK